MPPDDDLKKFLWDAAESSDTIIRRLISGCDIMSAKEEDIKANRTCT
jgi:hypothetical protein